jgi:hypothetical protein
LFADLRERRDPRPQDHGQCHGASAPDPRGGGDSTDAGGEWLLAHICTEMIVWLGGTQVEGQ